MGPHIRKQKVLLPKEIEYLKETTKYFGYLIEDYEGNP